MMELVIGQTSIGELIKPVEIMGVTHQPGQSLTGVITDKNGYTQFSTMIGIGCWVELDIDKEVKIIL